MSIPSISNLSAFSISYNLKIMDIIEDLPAPVRPIIPTFSPYLIFNVRPFNA